MSETWNSRDLRKVDTRVVVQWFVGASQKIVLWICFLSTLGNQVLCVPMACEVASAGIRVNFSVSVRFIFDRFVWRHRLVGGCLRLGRPSQWLDVLYEV